MPFLNGKQAEKKQTMEDKMTTELEKEFFETFNIKSEMGCTAYEKLSESKADSICTDYCPECKYFEDVYPKITDRHYLELYCTLCDAFNILRIDRHPAFTFRVKDFKECILKDLIMVNTFYKSEYVKHQVQQLFI